jgi:K+-transporting ATPase ATPase C chain
MGGILNLLMQSLRATVVLAFLTGIIFPLMICGVGQVLFPKESKGSLITAGNGIVLGSALIAQRFSKPEYFHPRPSAAGSGYAGEASGGTNLGPTSKKLFAGQPDDPKTPADESFAGVKQLADSYRKENLLSDGDLVPVDAVTRSGSGLDPDVSVHNANLQAKRVAEARHMPLQLILDEVKRATEPPQFGFLGEPRVNVLRLNQMLDQSGKQ